VALDPERRPTRGAALVALEPAGDGVVFATHRHGLRR
jgi:hypothetical protein